MRTLLRKGTTFEWSEEDNKSFCEVKKQLASDRMLSMFDPSLTVVVSTDASAYGLGAVLQHEDRSIFRTVAFSSRSLTDTERKYSTGEREALACLWACEKWHVYLWARHFTLQTDHQALVSVMSTERMGHRPLRITRQSERLFKYNFTVKYRSAQENKVADALSRLPLRTTKGSRETEEEVIATVTPCVTKTQLQQATADDTVLQVAIRSTTSVWPARKSLATELIPYYQVREDLSAMDKQLLRHDRIVIQSRLTSTLVQLAHETHQSIRCTKQRLRELYWWPRIDRQVDVAIESCTVCQASDKSA